MGKLSLSKKEKEMVPISTFLHKKSNYVSTVNQKPVWHSTENIKKATLPFVINRMLTANINSYTSNKISTNLNQELLEAQDRNHRKDILNKSATHIFHIGNDISLSSLIIQFNLQKIGNIQNKMLLLDPNIKLVCQNDNYSYTEKFKNINGIWQMKEAPSFRSRSIIKITSGAQIKENNIYTGITISLRPLNYQEGLLVSQQKFGIKLHFELV